MHIPGGLTLEDLPISFQFYDSILQNLRNLISVDRKEYYDHMNKVAIENFKKHDVFYSLNKTLLDYNNSDKFHHKLMKIKLQDAEFLDH